MHTYKEKIFEEFRENCEKRVYAFAFRLTRNRDDAHDLLQDAVIRAWGAFDPQGRAPSEAWLKQIVLNCFVDDRRRAKRQPPTTSLELIQAQNQRLDPLDSSPQADAVLLGKTVDRRLVRALSTLSRTQRALVLARVVKEVPYTTLAEVYETKVTTIKSRVYRALELLRDQLYEEEHRQCDRPGRRDNGANLRRRNYLRRFFIKITRLIGYGEEGFWQ